MNADSEDGDVFLASAIGGAGLSNVLGGSDLLHFDTKLLSGPEDTMGDLADWDGQVDDRLTPSFPLGDVIVADDEDSTTGALGPQKPKPHPFLFAEADRA